MVREIRLWVCWWIRCDIWGKDSSQRWCQNFFLGAFSTEKQRFYYWMSIARPRMLTNREEELLLCDVGAGPNSSATISINKSQRRILGGWLQAGFLQGQMRIHQMNLGLSSAEMARVKAWKSEIARGRHFQTLPVYCTLTFWGPLHGIPRPTAMSNI